MTLREDAKKFPFYHALIVLFLAVGLCGISLDFFFNLFIEDAYIVKLLSGITVRLIVSICAVVLIFKYGFCKIIKNRISLLSFFAIIPAIIIAINNFPIIGLIKGDVVIEINLTHKFLFIIYCLFVALFEETVFRGVVFPLCYMRLKDKKNNIFWSIVLSSALFSVTHLLNLFGGASIMNVLLQIGYSFLIGAMCAICLVKTGNLFVSVIIHFVYDIGGMLLGNYGIATGTQWDTITIIITVILSIIVGFYMLFMVFRFKTEDINRLFLEE